MNTIFNDSCSLLIERSKNISVAKWLLTAIHNKKAKRSVTIKEHLDYDVDGIYEGIPVWLLTSNKAFREESVLMGNCVGKCDEEDHVEDLNPTKEGKYFKRYKEGFLLVYSFRDPLNKNKPVVNLLLKRKHNSPYKLKKLLGPLNEPVHEAYRNACLKFIKHKDLEMYSDNTDIKLI